MQRTPSPLLPTLPGIYLFKDTTGTIVYIGKAKSLRRRVNSYFQKNPTDWKLQAIQESYADLDFIVTHSETEAMLLEAELIQRYQPQFNTIFKTGQPFVYILFANSKPLPTVTIVRNKTKKGTYFGPFLHKRHARSVLQFLINTFQLNACNKKIENGCLDYHIGNCPGTCKSDFDKTEYLFRLELAKEVLRKKDAAFIEKIKLRIAEYNKQLFFEKSKRLHEYLNNVTLIFDTIKAKYNSAKFASDIIIATTPIAHVAQISDNSAQELKNLTGGGTIRTIDCFDISHFQSRFIVGSCIRFTDGKPDKYKFRRFEIKS